MKAKYRDNGAIGAILDEYERAINDIIFTINYISNNELIEIIDFNSKDEDCRSIQSILSHIVQSGKTYVIEIRRWLGEDINYEDIIILNSTKAYKSALKNMFNFNEKLFNDYPNLKLYEYNPDNKINTRWGQKYDVNQLFEHAIIHILRHRRQIERFKLKLKTI